MSDKVSFLKFMHIAASLSDPVPYPNHSTAQLTEN